MSNVNFFDEKNKLSSEALEWLCAPKLILTGAVRYELLSLADELSGTTFKDDRLKNRSFELIAAIDDLLVEICHGGPGRTTGKGSVEDYTVYEVTHTQAMREFINAAPYFGKVEAALICIPIDHPIAQAARKAYTEYNQFLKT